MRVWDKFLTERDKQILAATNGAAQGTGFGRSAGFGHTPALLLIDNYVAGLGDRPLPVLESIKTFPLSIGKEGWDAVAQQKRLLDICRDLGLLVIHTNLDIAPNSPRDWISGIRGDIGRRTMAADQAKLDPPTGVKPFDFTPALRPLAEEPVILKSGPSAFHGTTLLNVLIRHNVDTLLICGESTSGCVRATVVDAASYNFRTIVIEECVYDRTEAAHALSLFDIDQKYGDVIGIDQTCEWLRKTFGLVAAMDGTQGV